MATMNNLLRATSRGLFAGLLRPKFGSFTKPLLPACSIPAIQHQPSTLVHTAQALCKKKDKSRFSDPMVWGDPAKQHLRPSVHWKVERYLATALIPLIPASLMFPHPAMDYLLAGSLVLHAYWGLDTVAVDYIHRKVLPPAVCEWLILIFAALGFAGICMFNYNDIGCTGAVKYFWALDKKDAVKN